MTDTPFKKTQMVDPARLMDLIAHTRGAQFSPAGILIVPLEGRTAPAEILEFMQDRLSTLANLRPTGRPSR